MRKIGLGLIVLASALYANEATKLDSMTISTATKSEKQIDGVAASVEVITLEDLQRSGGTTIRESLEGVASFNAQHNAFPSANAISKSAISIRGMSAAGTLILIDGKRLAGEVNSPYDLDRIPSGAIEKIEVVKGPMSTLYGADAMGGVINIITKKPTKTPAISLDLQSGANSDGDGRKSAISFDIRGKKASYDYALYLSALESSPYNKGKTVEAKLPNNSPFKTYNNAKTSFQEDSEVYNAGFRVAKNFEKSTLGVDFGYMDEEREGRYVSAFHPRKQGFMPPAVLNAPVRSVDENKRLNVGVDYEHTVSDEFALKARTYMSDYTKRNTTTALDWASMGYASEAESGSSGMDGGVLVRSYEIGAVYMPIDSHKITFSGEYRSEDRDATVFTQSNDKTHKDVNYKSFYLQDEWEIDDSLNAIFGARYDDISTADEKTTFRVGVIKSFAPLAKVRASFAQGYRAPDLRELYINKQTPTGKNEGSEVQGYNLKPESVDSYELALSGRDSALFYEIVGFYSKVKDRITQVNTGGMPAVYTWQNIGKAEIYGAELAARYEFDSGAVTKFSAIKMQAKDKENNKRIDFTVEEKAVASVDVPFLDSFEAGVEVIYTGSQKYQENGASKTASDFTLTNLRGKYKIDKEKEIFAGVNNAASAKIDEILGESVGAFFYAGARLKF